MLASAITYIAGVASLPCTTLSVVVLVIDTLPVIGLLYALCNLFQSLIDWFAILFVDDVTFFSMVEAELEAFFCILEASLVTVACISVADSFTLFSAESKFLLTSLDASPVLLLNCLFTWSIAELISLVIESPFILPAADIWLKFFSTWPAASSMVIPARIPWNIIFVVSFIPFKVVSCPLLILVNWLVKTLLASE